MGGCNLRGGCRYCFGDDPARLECSHEHLAGFRVRGVWANTAEEGLPGSPVARATCLDGISFFFFASERAEQVPDADVAFLELQV